MRSRLLLPVAIIAVLTLIGCLPRPSEPPRWHVVRRAGEDVYLTDIFFLDEERGWVVGRNGLIYRTSNGGITWERMDAGLREDFYSVFFLDERRGWIAGGGTVRGESL